VIEIRNYWILSIPDSEHFIIVVKRKIFPYWIQTYNEVTASLSLM